VRVRALDDDRPEIRRPRDDFDGSRGSPSRAGPVVDHRRRADDPGSSFDHRVPIADNGADATRHHPAWDHHGSPDDRPALRAARSVRSG
jgi:hypothetical protein